MARTLKNSGPAASHHWVMAVEDDGTTIKLWTTPGTSTGWTDGSGITLGGSSPPSVTTGKTWNSTSRNMVHFGANSLLTITTPVALSSPMCFWMVVKDFNAQADAYILRGSASAGGTADGSGPSVLFNSTPLLVMRNVDAGTVLSLSLHSWSANEDVSWFLHDIASGDNLTYLAAEGAALSGINYTVTDPSINFSSVYAKFIGSGTTPSWSGDIVAMGLTSAAISESDAAAIHSDPIGTLFEPSGGPSTPTTPTTTSIAATTVTVGATTTETSGTRYVVVTTSATPPALNGDGTGFIAGSYADSDSASIGGAGAFTYSITGLTASTTYYHHHVIGVGGVDSGILTSSSFDTLSAGGTFTSEPLKLNNGSVLASQALNYVALYNDTTNALVIKKTGLSTDGSGIFTFSDALVVPGTTYRVDWEAASGQRRMPRKPAT